MSLAKTSIQRPLMMIMVILAVAMFGLVAWQKLPIDQMPKMDLPYVMVQMIYPGASPEEIEVNVIKPVEEQISTLSGIKTMTSYCMENAGTIVLEFNADVSADIAAIDVKDRIGQISRLLPSDLEDPIIMKIDINAAPIVTIALLGDTAISPIELRKYADKNLKDRFSQLPGVAQAVVSGGREREIQVSLKSEKLAAHNLSIFGVFPAFTSQNVLIPGGYVTGDYKEYSVNAAMNFYNNRLLFKTNLGYAENNDNANFVGDASLEYWFNDEGNWRIRAFYFNDKTGNNISSKPQQGGGVGISFQQEFNNRKDFSENWAPKKKKKKSQKNDTSLKSINNEK
jgi:HAE1 family hydrophobic/amphiphilic exporter-1